MDELHSETLDFLMRAMKAKQLEAARADSSTQRKTFHVHLENLRKRITLEFFYQMNRKNAGEPPP